MDIWRSNNMPIDGEFKLIERIKRWVGPPSSRVFLGIGDDAAVALPPAEKLLTTIDMLVEGVHFDFSYMTPRELGHKALAVNLSDIAAMGGEPWYALVSLGLNDSLGETSVEAFYAGMLALAQKYGVEIIGGNLVRSPDRVIVDISIIGQSKGRVLSRQGANPGDVVAVTGYPGASAAGLAILKKLGRNGIASLPTLGQAHLMPEPRVREGQALAQLAGVTALIDISDGIANEANHLASSSEVRVQLDREKFRFSSETQQAASQMGKDPLDWALRGGEDYELLVTLVPATAGQAEAALKKLGTPLTVVGQVSADGSGVVLKAGNGEVSLLPPGGWDHFPNEPVRK
jgi:thiamine-monophosphate kinase